MIWRWRALPEGTSYCLMEVDYSECVVYYRAPLHRLSFQAQLSIRYSFSCIIRDCKRLIYRVLKRVVDSISRNAMRSSAEEFRYLLVEAIREMVRCPLRVESLSRGIDALCPAHRRSSVVEGAARGYGTPVMRRKFSSPPYPFTSDALAQIQQPTSTEPNRHANASPSAPDENP